MIYIYVRCRVQPELGPALPEADRDVSRSEKLRLLRSGLLPLFIFAAMMVPFVNGWTSLVESSAVGAAARPAGQRAQDDQRDPNGRAS